MRTIPAAVAALVGALVSIPSHADWLTYGHDPQRTGWAQEETDLTPENVAGMTLLWKSKLDVQSVQPFRVNGSGGGEQCVHPARPQDRSLRGWDLRRHFRD